MGKEKSFVQSMTGYGRGEASSLKGSSWIVEIQSLNRKGLDIQIQLPKGYLRLEIPLRKEIAKVIERGQITLRAQSISPSLNKGVEKKLSILKKEWEKIATNLKKKKEEITLSFLIARYSEEKKEEEEITEEEEKACLKATQKALKHLLIMKQKEGHFLFLDLQERWKEIEKSLAFFQTHTEAGVEKYREKLLEKLSSFLKEKIEDERLLKEIALFAEKTDITEEIVRLKSHLKQAQSLCLNSKESKGRALEFLLQEIQREINTIGSKAGELAISKEILKIKGELEKIKEQVQNIE